MGRYLDLAKCAIEEAHGQPGACHRPELNPTTPLYPCEPGALRERVLAIITGLTDPLGLSEWLKLERTDLILRGWELFAAVDQALILPNSGELERVLAQLAAYHADCCRQYQLHLQNALQGVLEGPQMASGQSTRESPQSCRQPAQKANWTEGPHCPYCEGTWHSEEALAEHGSQCPLGIKRRQ